MSSLSPSGGMKEMVRSFSKRDRRTHWWNFTSSSSTVLLFSPNTHTHTKIHKTKQKKIESLSHICRGIKVKVMMTDKHSHTHSSCLSLSLSHRMLPNASVISLSPSELLFSYKTFRTCIQNPLPSSSPPLKPIQLAHKYIHTYTCACQKKKKKHLENLRVLFHCLAKNPRLVCWQSLRFNFFC